MQPPSFLSRLAALAERVAEAERGRFAPLLAVALAAGAAWYFAQAHEPPPRMGPALMTGGVMLAALGRRWWPVLAGGLLVVAFGVGVGAAHWATWRAPSPAELPTRATIVVGRVAMAEALPQGVRVLLAEPRLDGGPALARALRIRLRPGDASDPRTGDLLRVRAMLLPPSGAPIPGGWDIQFDAFHTGIAGFGYALNPAELVERRPPEGLAGRMRALQEAIRARVHDALPGSTGTIAAGLMVGGVGAIAAADQAAFRDSGIYHLLSISGLHLAIAMGLVFAAVRFGLAAVERCALHLPVKAIAAVCALASGGFYTLLTGAQVPMLRSFAGACLVTLAILAGRRALSLRAWALALAAVLVVAPYEVARVGFQMSFAAALALVAGFEVLRPWLRRVGQGGGWHRVLAWVAALAATSALAGTATLPFGAYHFGAVQIYYVLANMVAVPITSVVVMPAAVLALLLMPLGAADIALVPMGWGVDALLWVGQLVAAWPQAVLPVPQIAAWGLVAYALGLAWLALWRSRLRLLGVAGIVAGVGSAGLYVPPDLLISADARLVALRAGGVLHVQRSAASGFVLDSWLQHLGLRDWRAMPGPGGRSDDGAVVCGADRCTLRPRPDGPAAVLARGAAGEGLCDAALVLATVPLRLGCDVAVIDRFSVWREGAHAVWLDPQGLRIVTDRATRGDRRWVSPLPTRSRQQPGRPLPVAPVDTPSAAEGDAVE